MKIVLDNIGRRFNQEWIFRKVNYSFETGISYAILGPNGTGKSTLLNIIAGSLAASEGEITYNSQALVNIDTEQVYSQLSISAPYMELVEELTLTEHLAFHFSFKNLPTGLTFEYIYDLLGFTSKVKERAIKYFSSGMKQRTKLVLAVCSDTPVLLLDEPTSNLDQSGIRWYADLLDQFSKDRIVIISSNQEHEYARCTMQLQVEKYKPI